MPDSVPSRPDALGSAAHARPDRARPGHGHLPGRGLCRRPGRPPLDESIAIKSGRVEGVAAGESEGFGVRVLVDGAWGFASSAHPARPREADRVAAEAVRIARASATALREPAVLDDRPPAHGTYETPVVEDPFAVPLERKIADLLAADEAASEVKGIAFTESMYAAQREWKTFAATDGSLTEQTITHVGSAVEANAVDGDEHQRRSYPD